MVVPYDSVIAYLRLSDFGCTAVVREGGGGGVRPAVHGGIGGTAVVQRAGSQVVP